MPALSSTAMLKLFRFAYSLIAYGLQPLLAAYLAWRARKQSAYWQYWPERFFGSVPVCENRPVWFHAVSLGETLALGSLLKQLRQRAPDLPLLLTHTTPTGREAGEKLAGEIGNTSISYLPYDTPFAVKRFLARAKPRVGVLMETELWPNLIRIGTGQGLAMHLINARLSAKSFARAQRYQTIARDTLARLSLVACQDELDAQNLKSLGAKSPVVLGNLKFDVIPDPTLLERGRRWRTELNDRSGGRRILLLANSRETEEALFLRAWRDSALASSQVVAMIVPRHPQRFDEVAALAEQHGFAVSRRSTWSEQWPLDASSNTILLGDSLGEMPAYYAMSDVTIMGGSFAPLGGHNLVESCACISATVLGPHTFNFRLASEQAINAGAARRAGGMQDALELSEAWLNQPVSLGQARQACQEFSKKHRGASERTLALLKPWLEKTS